MALLQRYSARLIATTNINISVTGVGVAIDGIAMADLDDVVLAGQTTEAENGYWVANSGGAWSRHPDFSSAAEMLKGTEFFIREGNTDNAGSTWTFDTSGAITVGTTPLRFKRESYGPGAAIHDDDTLTRDPLTNQWTLKDQFTPEGYFSRVQTDSFGRVQDAVVSDLAATHIEGLKVVYDGPAALTVEAGAAHVPGEGGVVELDETSLSGLALTANTWYAVYLFESGGTGAIEVVTQMPESIPYLGNARIKGPDGGPDASRRYLGAIRVTATNNMMRFRKNGAHHMHLADWNTLASSGGLKIHNLARISATNNTPLDTDCSPLVPPHVRVAEVQGRLSYVSAGGAAWFRHSENANKSRYAGTVSASSGSSAYTMLVETDSAQHIEAIQADGAAKDIELACIGFIEEV